MEDAVDPQCPDVDAFARALIDTIESSSDRLEATEAARKRLDAFETRHQVSCARCQSYQVEQRLGSFKSDVLQFRRPSASEMLTP